MARIATVRAAWHTVGVVGDAPDSPVTNRSGLLLAGRYRVQSLLATGGSGSVWLAEHLALRRLVVAKFPEAPTARGSTAIARFMREARLLSSVRHRNVIQLHEVGKTDQGEPYLILERLRGESLAQRLAREGALSIRLSLSIALALCDGLEAVHAAGVIHRDVKPENIVLHEDEDANEIVPKLLDFGIARAMRTGNAITTSGAAIGTPGYMAPEQARGDDVDARADLYSLGVTLYELLSGELPFEGESMADLLAANAEREPLPISVWGPELCGPLAEAVMRALAVDREERYPTARAMRRALAAVREEHDASAKAGRVPSSGAKPAVIPRHAASSAAPDERRARRSTPPER